MKHFMKPFLSILFLGLASSAGAVSCKFYAGLGGGYGSVNTPNKNVFNVSADPAGNTSHSIGGVSGRAFAGFNFIEYFGIEAGYARYARSYYSGSEPTLFLNSSLTYYDHSYDVVGKGYLPLAHSGFVAYGLVGGARVVQTVKFNNESIPLNGEIATPTQNGSNHIYKTLPIYGVGVMYEFGPNFSSNVELTQIHGSGNMNTQPTAVPNLNLVTLNIAYHFD